MVHYVAAIVGGSLFVYGVARILVDLVRGRSFVVPREAGPGIDPTVVSGRWARWIAAGIAALLLVPFLVGLAIALLTR